MIDWDFILLCTQIQKECTEIATRIYKTLTCLECGQPAIARLNDIPLCESCYRENTGQSEQYADVFREEME